jgi:hypothetical protein
MQAGCITSKPLSNKTPFFENICYNSFRVYYVILLIIEDYTICLLCHYFNYRRLYDLSMAGLVVGAAGARSMAEASSIAVWGLAPAKFECEWPERKWLVCQQSWEWKIEGACRRGCCPCRHTLLAKFGLGRSPWTPQFARVGFLYPPICTGPNRQHMLVWVTQIIDG